MRSDSVVYFFHTPPQSAPEPRLAPCACILDRLACLLRCFAPSMHAPQTDKINIAHDGSEHPTAAHKYHAVREFPHT